MQNHTCPRRYGCDNYNSCRCDGCNDSLIDFNRHARKLILVGMINRNEEFEFMNCVVGELSKRSVDVIYIDHNRIRFRTTNTEVWFIWSTLHMNNLLGVRADGIFGHRVTEEMLARASKDAVISNRDRIGLVDYIEKIEREASESRYPKQIYISTARHNGRSAFEQAFKQYLNSTNVPYVEISKGENTMSIETERYVRQDISSLAAAFKRVNDAFNKKLPGIKNVIFSGPCTIVLWEDGTKTVVRCNNDVLDPEKGLAMAIAKKAMGTNKSGSNYYDIFKKWLPKPEVEEETTEEVVEEEATE